MNREDFKYLKIIIPISLIAFFSIIWIRPADLMEARNFITAREMIESKNYIIPTLNGALRFEKPPLPTWFTVLTMNLTQNYTDETILRIPSALTGVIFILLLYYFVKLLTKNSFVSFTVLTMNLTQNYTDETILRIPSALTGVIFILLLYYFVKLLTKNSFVSFITSFVGCTTFMIIKLSGENTWDIYSYVAIFGAVTFLLKGFNTSRYFDFIISGIFLAASILSKGPVAIYGLFLPFLLSHIFVFGLEKYRKNFKKILLLLLVGGILAGIWPLLMYLKYPDVFVSVLLKEKNTWTTKHTESLFYYLDYFIYMGVWMFFSLFALIKTYKNSENKDYFKFIFWWNILTIILLSLVKMKKKRYGIPIYITSILEIGIICNYFYNRTWESLKRYEYGIPIYITSILEIGIICNYFYNRTWESLKRYERYLIYLQKYFLIALSLVIPILLFFKGYSKNLVTKNYMFLIALLFLSFALILIKISKTKLNKVVILGSGVLMLIVNLTVNSFFDKQSNRNIFNLTLDKNYSNIEEVQKNPPKYNIYSKNYEIEDVWRVGKKINDYYLNEELPNEIVFFNEIPEGLLENYRVLKEDIYIKDDRKLAKLTYLEKMED